MSATANGSIVRATGLLVIEVINSNPNGDPDRESDPRQRPDGRGEISPVSFKRKLRDLVDDKAGPVWVALQKELKLTDEQFHGNKVSITATGGDVNPLNSLNSTDQTGAVSGLIQGFLGFVTDYVALPISVQYKA